MVKTKTPKNGSKQAPKESWSKLQKRLLEQGFMEDLGEIEWTHRRIGWTKEDHEEYLKWLDGFFKKKDIVDGGSGKKSAKKLQEVLLEINQISPQLLNEILKTCYRANRYELDFDFGVKHRLRVREFKKEISPQRTAIKTLCKIWERYPEITNTVVVQAYASFRRNFQSDNRRSLSFVADSLSYGKFLQGLLEEFDQVLNRGKIMGQMGDNFLTEFLVGPLRYPRSLQKQRAQPQARENGLLFHLTILFRWATDSEGIFPVPFKAGSPMPKRGKPHYSFVSFLAEVTLERPFSPNQVRERIRELTQVGVKWWGWPSRSCSSPSQK